MDFRALHHQNTPLIMCNVWDAMSAKTAERLGFQALGTSSAAMSNMLGYDDGENLNFTELCYLVKQIRSVSSLPLSVDLEAGYGQEPLEVVENIMKLAHFGIVGINIEDSRMIDGARKLMNAEVFAQSLAQIKSLQKQQGLDIFINARIDAYVTSALEPARESKKRAKLYAQAGADGIFVPCIEKSEEIEGLGACCALPINVMCMPELPSFERLKELGVRRVSMGNFLFDKMHRFLDQQLSSIQKNQSFAGVC